MSGSFLRQDLTLHRAVDQYILLKWRMETNSLCVEVYEDRGSLVRGLFSPPPRPTGPAFETGGFAHHSAPSLPA